MKFPGRFDMLFTWRGGWFAAFLFAVLLAAIGIGGCANDFERPMRLSDLDDPNPTVRVMAAKWACDNKVVEAAAPLVNLLSDEDKAVRFYAIEALRCITGKDLGYKYQDSSSSRAEAVERWRTELSLTE